MSKYTTELRFICEFEAGLNESKGYDSMMSIIANSWKNIFSFNFPIFDETYRQVLCTKFLKRYYTREICEETYGLWKLRLDSKFNEIMPYYNKLYEAWKKEFDLFTDTNLKRTHHLTKEQHQFTSNESNSQSNSESNSTALNLYSDAPQGSIANIENQTYLTNATKITSEDSSSDTSTSNDSESNTLNSEDDYVESLIGKSSGASYPSLLNDYKDSLINIDVMILDECKGLFLQLW